MATYQGLNKLPTEYPLRVTTRIYLSRFLMFLVIILANFAGLGIVIAVNTITNSSIDSVPSETQPFEEINYFTELNPLWANPPSSLDFSDGIGGWTDLWISDSLSDTDSDWKRIRFSGEDPWIISSRIEISPERYSYVPIYWSTEINLAPNATITTPEHLFLRTVVLSSASIPNAFLKGSNLSSANLSYIILAHANLSYANLIDANLTRANLIDANLSYANLTGANLTGANLTGANLTGALLNQSNLINTIMPNGEIWDVDTEIEQFTDPSHPSYVDYKAKMKN